jgi:hypothetical protein
MIYKEKIKKELKMTLKNFHSILPCSNNVHNSHKKLF